MKKGLKTQPPKKNNIMSKQLKNVLYKKNRYLCWFYFN